MHVTQGAGLGAGRCGQSWTVLTFFNSYDTKSIPDVQVRSQAWSMWRRAPELPGPYVEEPGSYSQPPPLPQATCSACKAYISDLSCHSGWVVGGEGQGQGRSSRE